MSNIPRLPPKWRRSSITCATLLMGGITFCIMDDTIWAQRPLRDLNRADPVARPVDATPQAFRNVARHALPSLVAPRRLNFQSTQIPAPRRFSELGIETRDLTPATTPAWARHSVTTGSAARGVIVQAIRAGSPAAEAGLRPGLIIQRVGDRPVNSTEDLASLIFDQSDSRGVLLLVQSSREYKYLILGGDD